MVSLLGHMVLGMLTVGTAGAEEEAKEEAKDDSVKSMLDSLPAIEAPKSKAAQKPKPKKVMDYNAYNLSCSKVVMRRFKAPKGAVKDNPDIELELLVQVDVDGRVLSVGARIMSGDKGFDSAAVKALDKAGDLPVPPQGWNVDKDRVLLKFKGR